MRYVYFFYILFLFAFLTACKSDKTEGDFDLEAFQNLKAYFNKNTESCFLVLDSIAALNDKDAIIKQYRIARTYFKNIEPILAYVDVNNYKTLSGPNLPIIEEEDITNIRILEPKNFQVIEEHLFTEDPDINLVKLNAKFLSNRFKFLNKNTAFKFLNQESFLKMLRGQIIRTGTTGLAGFDSPAQCSIEEAKAVYNALKTMLPFFKNHFKDESLYKSWLEEFTNTISVLEHKNFEDFDRYNFIKTHTHAQMSLWAKTAKDWSAKLPKYLTINPNAENLFSSKTFNKLSYLERKISDSTQVKQITTLGKRLFNDNKLGQKGGISCASCHKQDLYFTDGLPKSLGNNGNQLQRNSPTLLYTLLQRDYFHDSRIGGLENQIQDVISNPKEFGLDINQFLEAVKNNTQYDESFKKAFKDSITKRNIKIAIAYYVASLNPFNSKFDRNIRGDENTLTQSEINGFNIFTGKAACATCHFTPVFNGTIPPNFKHTELEVLGVPKTPVFQNAEIDSDLGRYYFFNTEERKHAFKTPTIRNIEKTAPYMHNGVYKTLEDVIRFYNVGGGHGIGIVLKNQTLPSDSLHLSEKEQKDLINFMKSLTDDLKDYK